jgi:hypothetical protein
MVDDSDYALQVDVLAAALRMEGKDSLDLLEFLATKFEGALPHSTTVKRGGWFLSGSRPVEQIVLELDELIYQITKEKSGYLNASVAKKVRGVVLNTTQVSVDEWTQAVAKNLAELAGKNAQTKDALEKFIRG